LQFKMMSTLIPLHTSDQFMRLWLYQNQKLIPIFQFARQFCLWAYSEQTSACTWCLFVAVCGSCPCQVCPEVVWRYHCTTV